MGKYQKEKAKVDAQRSNIISKVLREITVAAKQGGGKSRHQFKA